MYAIIETGGKQYRVQEGDVLDVELLYQDGEVKFDEVKFDKVLMIHDGQNPKIGLPHLEKCSVHAEVIAVAKGPKVIAFKYKRRKKYRRTVGHRQKYSRVKIKKIVAA